MVLTLFFVGLKVITKRRPVKLDDDFTELRNTLERLRYTKRERHIGELLPTVNHFQVDWMWHTARDSSFISFILPKPRSRSGQRAGSVGAQEVDTIELAAGRSRGEL